jgi:hypothetical protein
MTLEFHVSITLRTSSMNTQFLIPPANLASSLVTQHSMPMNDSYHQTYSSSDNYVDPPCVNCFGRVEQENLALNSSSPFSRPTTMQQDIPMNDLYGRSKSDDSASYLERSYAPFATRPEVVSHVFYVPNVHAFEPHSGLTNSVNFIKIQRIRSPPNFKIGNFTVYRFKIFKKNKKICKKLE